MIVKRDAAILGYAGEIKVQLDANHHNVCKYADKQDPNYISVRNILKSFILQHKSIGMAISINLDSSDRFRTRNQ